MSNDWNQTPQMLPTIGRTPDIYSNTWTTEILVGGENLIDRESCDREARPPSGIITRPHPPHAFEPPTGNPVGHLHRADSSAECPAM